MENAKRLSGNGDGNGNRKGNRKLTIKKIKKQISRLDKWMNRYFPNYVPRYTRHSIGSPIYEAFKQKMTYQRLLEVKLANGA